MRRWLLNIQFQQNDSVDEQLVAAGQRPVCHECAVQAVMLSVVVVVVHVVVSIAPNAT
jgi:hypothetical protein